jgi:hypothetical protein
VTAVVVIVIVLAVVAAGGLVVWMFVTRTPEQAASHDRGGDQPRRPETEDLARGADRPADPNAEAQGPAVGDARPGPSGPSVTRAVKNDEPDR